MYALFLFKAPNGVLPKYFYALPLSGMLVASLFLWINQRMKISMHAGGGGVLCGFLVAFYSVHSPAPLLLIIGAFLVSGLTISARLYLEKHRPIEVYSGWLFAFFITFCCNWFYPG
jgi:membrane-associated phospholipid phosphatase